MPKPIGARKRAHDEERLVQTIIEGIIAVAIGTAITFGIVCLILMALGIPLDMPISL